MFKVTCFLMLLFFSCLNCPCISFLWIISWMLLYYEDIYSTTPCHILVFSHSNFVFFMHKIPLICLSMMHVWIRIYWISVCFHKQYCLIWKSRCFFFCKEPPFGPGCGVSFALSTKFLHINYTWHIFYYINSDKKRCYSNGFRKAFVSSWFDIFFYGAILFINFHLPECMSGYYRNENFSLHQDSIMS